MGGCKIIGSKIKLSGKRLDDARKDYAWRTDPDLARLDAAPLLTSTYPEYLADYANELRYPSETRRLLAVETLDGKHVGNCGYFCIDETTGEAEIGIMIGERDYWDKGYGTDVVTTLIRYIFSKTKLNRVYLRTLDTNERAQKCFQKCGFTPYEHMTKDGYNFVLMEIYRNQWQEHGKEA